MKDKELLDSFSDVRNKTGIYDQVNFEIIDTTTTRLKDIRFTMGGHHYAYPELINEFSIYIDNRMDKDNIVATSIHEFVERTFMKFYGIDYDPAHELSNDIELIVRKFIAEELPKLNRKFIKGRT